MFKIKIFASIVLLIAFNVFAGDKKTTEANIFVVPPPQDSTGTVELADQQKEKKGDYLYHEYDLQIVYNSEYNIDGCYFKGPSKYPVKDRVRSELNVTKVPAGVRSVSCILEVGYYLMCFAPSPSNSDFVRQYVTKPTSFSGWTLSHILFPKSNFAPNSPAGFEGQSSSFICIKESD